jgi:alkylation response protein AidB-like acyl-CoA dehydrogenase
MDLRLTQDQQSLVDAFADIHTKHCTPEDVRAAESGPTPGHDVALWARVREFGALEMATPDQADGLSLLDLALVAEQHGRFLSPTPLIEAQVAFRLLARADAADPARTPTLALRPGNSSRAGLVPAGAVADDLVVLVDGRLVLVPLEGRRTSVANLGNLPLADVDLADGAGTQTIAEGDEALALFDQARTEWRALTGAALAGLSARALEIGVEYVKERKAFGKPVGQFQAVAHRLADRSSENDGAQLLAREAAWAASAEPDRFPALAAMSLAFSAETAIATTHDALHFHGGYGFMLEYAAQLYYRRARAWGAVLESPAQGYRDVATAHFARGGAA